MAQQIDQYGTSFNTSDGSKPVVCNTPVVIQTPQGPVQGNWTGTHAEPNKK